MFGIGFWEMAVIFLSALIVLGPERCVAFSKKIGRWFSKINREFENVRSEITDISSETKDEK